MLSRAHPKITRTGRVHIIAGTPGESVAEPLGVEHRHDEVHEGKNGQNRAEPDHEADPPNRSHATVIATSVEKMAIPRMSMMNSIERPPE
jgi:hypothetical protein